MTSQYIAHMESLDAHKAGVAKVIPPTSWVARKQGYDIKDIKLNIPEPVSQVVTGQRGVYQQTNVHVSPMSLQAYEKLANSKKHMTPKHIDHQDLQRIFWRNIKYTTPVYGSDVQGSLTDPDVKQWNVNTLDTVLQQVLKRDGLTIAGVNTAYIYVGMWKTDFTWHTEDMDLYSINFLHCGAPKTWYAIPPDHGHRFEEVTRQLYNMNHNFCNGFLRHKKCMVSPSILRSRSIPIQTVTQEAGEFIITFPYGYHAGFNNGFNIAESTNFATPRWIEYGKRATKCTCTGAVNIPMDTFVRLYQLDRFESWSQGKDDGPHPEDGKKSGTRSSIATNLPSRSLTKDSTEANVLECKSDEAQPNDPLGDDNVNNVKQSHVIHGGLDIASAGTKETVKFPGKCTRKRHNKREPIGASSAQAKKNKTKAFVRAAGGNVSDVDNLVQPDNADHIESPSHDESINDANQTCPLGQIEGKDSEFSLRRRSLRQSSRDNSDVTLKASKAKARKSLVKTILKSRVLQMQTDRVVIEKQNNRSETEPAPRSAMNVASTGTPLTNPESNIIFASRLLDDDANEDASSFFRNIGNSDERTSNATVSADDRSTSTAIVSANDHSPDSLSEATTLDPQNVGPDLVMYEELLSRGGVSIAVIRKNAKTSAAGSPLRRATTTTANSLEDLPGEQRDSEMPLIQKSPTTTENASLSSFMAPSEIEHEFNSNGCSPMKTQEDGGDAHAEEGSLVDIIPDHVNPIFDGSDAYLDNLRQFNSCWSSFVPHCSICAALSLRNHKGSRPMSSDWKKSSITLLPPESPIWVSKDLFDASRSLARKADKENTQLVRCSNCLVTVHLSCYGLTEIPPDLNFWACDSCQACRPGVVCSFCPTRGGALTMTTNNLWVHVLCALLDGATFDRQLSEKPITDVRCCYCRESTGNLLECRVEECDAIFHSTCALIVGASISKSKSKINLLEVMCTRYVNPDKIPIRQGEMVLAKDTDGHHRRARVLFFSDEISYFVGYLDGTFSNEPPSKLVPRERVPTEGEKIMIDCGGEGVCEATFVGFGHYIIYEVSFGEGNTVHLERDEIYVYEDELPKME